MSIWKDYHFKTNISKFSSPPKRIPENWKNIYFKYYQRFNRFRLPRFKPTGELEKIITSRRSRRKMSRKASEESILKILFYSCGVNYSGENPRIDSRRMYPSAGARYPVEAYLIINKKISNNLKTGIYHYVPLSNELETIDLEPSRELIKESFNQDFIANSPAILVLTAAVDRNYVKYGDRGYRYCLLEAGHIAQNVSLLSEKYGLGACCICGFKDEQIHNLLKIIDPEEIPLYAVTIN